MLTIDPMHNLFLGTGKHMLQHWIHQDIIPKSQYSNVQGYVDNVVVPSDVGRIPYKIVSGFSGFTADQFKNWIILAAGRWPYIVFTFTESVRNVRNDVNIYIYI